MSPETNEQKTSTLSDSVFDWKYTFPDQKIGDLEVIDDAFVDYETLKRIHATESNAIIDIRRKLNGKQTIAVNLLKIMCPRQVFFRLADDFQRDDSGLESERTFSLWASLLSVVLKGCFYNCASFAEMYEFKQEYGDTNELLTEADFMEMK